MRTIENCYVWQGPQNVMNGENRWEMNLKIQKKCTFYLVFQKLIQISKPQSNTVRYEMGFASRSVPSDCDGWFLAWLKRIKE